MEMAKGLAILDDPNNLADFMSHVRWIYGDNVNVDDKKENKPSNTQTLPSSGAQSPPPSEAPPVSDSVFLQRRLWPIDETGEEPEENTDGDEENKDSKEKEQELSVTSGRPGKSFITDIVTRHTGKHIGDYSKQKQSATSPEATSFRSVSAEPALHSTLPSSKSLTALPQIIPETQSEEDSLAKDRAFHIREVAIYESETQQHHGSVIHSSESGSVAKVADPFRDTDKAMASNEDREEQIYFNSWGQPLARNVPQSQPRTVILTNIPVAHAALDLTVIQSLIFFGAVEKIRFNPRVDSRVFVTFTSGVAAKRYYDNTANGVIYNQLSQNLQFVAWVDISKDNEPVSSRLTTQLECGASRVVIVKNCPKDYTIPALKRIAEYKGRVIEKVYESVSAAVPSMVAHIGTSTATTHVPINSTRRREVVFRFASIEHAVTFRYGIQRDEDFIDSQIDFGIDPCERAVRVHYD